MASRLRDHFWHSLGLNTCGATADAVLRALANATSLNELAGLMDTFSLELGFRHYALIHHDDLRVNSPHRVKILKYPRAIEDRIIGEGRWRKDPVIRACIFTPSAFRWSELPRLLDMDRHDMRSLEFGAASGLDDGITVPFLLARSARTRSNAVNPSNCSACHGGPLLLSFRVSARAWSTQ